MLHWDCSADAITWRSCLALHSGKVDTIDSPNANIIQGTVHQKRVLRRSEMKMADLNAVHSSPHSPP
jgi:hypothetical protein